MGGAFSERSADMRLAPSDLRGVTVFRSIVENSGFQGAQIELGMTQPTLSFHLKTFEERLGFELCRRGRAGLHLTERGKGVYEASKGLFAAIATFEGRLGELRGSVVGRLRVGVVANTVTDDTLPLSTIVDACLESAPAADVQLLVSHPEGLAEELVRDGIDIALTPPLNIGPGFHQQIFFHEMHSLYCGQKHPLFSVPSDEITPELIADHDFVARSYTRHEELQHYAGAKVRIRTSTMEAMAILILSGRVIGFLPEHFARHWEERSQMRRLNIEEHRYASPFVVVSKIGRPPSALYKLFVSKLHEHALPHALGDSLP
jgi:DNA-binding transcriptional LysR family regulator